MTLPDNRQVEVRYRRGLWGTIRGENTSKAISRETAALNSDGYRVVQHIPDAGWSLWRRSWNWWVSTLSLGIFGTKPAGLLIAERRTD